MSKRGAAAPRQRMHGPVRLAEKRSRSAKPEPVVRETSRRTGTTAGSAAYRSPPSSSGSRPTCRSSRRPSPELSPRRPSEKMSVRWAIPPVIARGSALLGGLLLRPSGRLLLAVGVAAVAALVAVAALLVVLLELALEDLARRGPRQLVDEVDVE